MPWVLLIPWRTRPQMMPSQQKRSNVLKVVRLTLCHPFPLGESAEQQEKERQALLKELNKRNNHRGIREKIAKTFSLPRQVAAMADFICRRGGLAELIANVCGMLWICCDTCLRMDWKQAMLSIHHHLLLPLLSTSLPAPLSYCVTLCFDWSCWPSLHSCLYLKTLSPTISLYMPS